MKENNKKKSPQQNKKTQNTNELSPKTVMIFRIFIIVALLATLVAIGLIVYESVFKKHKEEENPYKEYYVLNNEGVISDLTQILDIKTGEGDVTENIEHEALAEIIREFVDDESKTIYLLFYHSLSMSDELDGALLGNEALKKGETVAVDVEKGFVFLLIDLDNMLLSDFVLNDKTFPGLDANLYNSNEKLLIINFVEQKTNQKDFFQNESKIIEAIKDIK